MKIAIYSRKSKFTGKGESVENQIQLCRDYIASHIDGGREAELLIYEDEGFSGGNTERPQYQQMLHDADAKEFEVLVCYRLDRLSRNISDFSDLINDLQAKQISFVSIREQFDTSTPMGRAMMYIASVFAQLERETIAERIRDNMIELAKTGRWLGGVTPTGFKSVPVTAMDDHGRLRKAFMLKPIKDEIKTVKLLYEKYLEFGSITKLEAYCLQNGIVTKNGKEYTRFSLRLILTNPVYACADERLYNYLIEKGFEVYCKKEDFDSKHGVIAYNKTIQQNHKANRRRQNDEWIVTVGGHEAIVPSENWIAAQKLAHYNKETSVRRVQNPQSLLSGLLRCANCGSYMRPKPGRIDANGQRIFYYMCERKERSRRSLCDISNANGREMDALVIDQIKKLAESDSALVQQLRQNTTTVSVHRNTVDEQIQQIESKIKNNQAAINRLVDGMASAEGSAASVYLIQRINSLHAENGDLKSRLLKLRDVVESDNQTVDAGTYVEGLLSAFSSTIDTLDVTGKRALLRTVLDSVIWDGQKVTINLFNKKNSDNVSTV